MAPRRINGRLSKCAGEDPSNCSWLLISHSVCKQQKDDMKNHDVPVNFDIFIRRHGARDGVGRDEDILTRNRPASCVDLELYYA